jgi:hypothetical protein
VTLGLCDSLSLSIVGVTTGESAVEWVDQDRVVVVKAAVEGKEMD